MIRTSIKLFMAGFVLAIMAGPFVESALARGTLTTTYKFYPVSGSTARSLHGNMTVPVGFFSSERSYANITMKSSFKGKFTKGKTCRIKGFGIDAKFIVRLPRLRKGVRLSSRLKRQFNSFAAYVRKHELTHRRIWTRCLRNAERRVNALSIRNCNKLDNVAAGIIRGEWAKCAVRNARFDKLERKRLLKLSLVKAALRPARRPRSVAKASKRSRSHTSSQANSGYRRSLGRFNN